MNLDLQDLDLHPSQLLFRVEVQPSYGQLRLDPGPDAGAAAFTMLDLWQGRVSYVHGGAEVPMDSFAFSVSSAGKKPPPEVLSDRRLYRLHVDVSPVEDPPVLSLPEGDVFTVVDRSKRKVGTGTAAAELTLTLTPEPSS